MNHPDSGPENADTQDPDSDPEMLTSGTKQPDQAEGGDDPAETGNAS
jgi:hypothetical protein